MSRFIRVDRYICPKNIQLEKIMCYLYSYQTVIGALHIMTKADKLIRISFTPVLVTSEICCAETDLHQMIIAQIEEYLAGNRRIFTLPINMEGTHFQKQVWEALLTIPYGETRSYANIARQIGNPKACRAVGMANNRNPLPIIVPCHRVIGANGSLVGYAGGLAVKEYLLKIE